MRSMHGALQIPVGDVALDADVVAPASARGAVVFAHGSGSGRFSPRNRFVAAELQSGGLATVLADLLTVDEERLDATDGSLRFDIALLASRVIGIVDWLATTDPFPGLPFGLFGASTGAAAALITAARRPELVAAVVSRGGRPDLAGDELPLVRQPTLLLVGELDETVVELNVLALQRLPDAHLETVPGATHLFEEPGTLAQVARRAREWFTSHLTPA